MKKEIILLIISLTIIALPLYFIQSCGAQTLEEEESTTTQLSQPSDLKRIIYENDKVIMIFGFHDFLKLVVEKIVADYNLISLLSNEIQKKDKIFINEVISLGKTEESKLQSIIASLLRKGKVILYDKEKCRDLDAIKIIVNKINYSEPQCGTFAPAKVINYTTPDGRVFFQSYLRIADLLPLPQPSDIPSDRQKSSTIRLSQPSDPKKIRFDTNNFIMTFGYSDFVTQLTTEGEYERDEEVGHLVGLFKNEIQKKDEIILDQTMFWKIDKVKFIREVYSTIAPLLKEGKLILYDNKRGQYVDAIRRVEVKEWHFTAGQSQTRYKIHYETPYGVIFYWCNEPRS